MAQLLNEIEWGEPILPRVADPEWEATIKRRGAPLGEAEQRVSPIKWIRETCLWVLTYRAREIPERLSTMGAMVAAQEVSCRYCYGAPAGVNEDAGLLGVDDQPDRTRCALG